MGLFQVACSERWWQYKAAHTLLRCAPSQLVQKTCMPLPTYVSLCRDNDGINSHSCDADCYGRLPTHATSIRGDPTSKR